MKDDGLLRKITAFPQKACIAAIRFYQTAISPLFPRCCRYVPSCSQYTLDAVRKYGFLKGFWLGLKRVLRCHPWHPGGYDPVP